LNAHSSHIGFAPELSREARRAALQSMLACLDHSARVHGIQLIAANGLCGVEADDLEDVFESSGYARVTTIPNVVLDLPFRSVDGYLDRHSPSSPWTMRGYTACRASTTVADTAMVAAGGVAVALAA
jgi:hypothetical protein